MSSLDKSTTFQSSNLIFIFSISVHFGNTTIYFLSNNCLFELFTNSSSSPNKSILWINLTKYPAASSHSLELFVQEILIVSKSDHAYLKFFTSRFVSHNFTFILFMFAIHPFVLFTKML